MTKGVGGSSVERELEGLKAWANHAPVISADERARRIERARKLMRIANVDTLLIGAGASLDYFCGVRWGQSERLVALMLPRRGKPVVICPGFELGSLEAALAIECDIRIWEEDEDPYALVATALGEFGTARLAIDPALPLFMLEGVRRAAPSLDGISASPIVDGCRMFKSPAEIALMQQAKDMTLEVQRRAARILRTGISAGEVRHFIDLAHRALGADGSIFCIVEFGRSTAFPHGLPEEARLAEGDFVLIDTGCRVGGYLSDITRTYVFGDPTDEQRHFWNLERAAQQAAFDAARPGETCESVDAAARDIGVRAGLGPDYRLPGMPHRTGHGIGLSLHEPAYLVRGDRTPLKAGMCFSNEPMIVVPDRFGVRLEDHFYMTDDGARWFTQPSPSIDNPFG